MASEKPENIRALINLAETVAYKLHGCRECQNVAEPESDSYKHYSRWANEYEDVFLETVKKLGRLLNEANDSGEDKTT